MVCSAFDVRKQIVFPEVLIDQKAKVCVLHLHGRLFPKEELSSVTPSANSCLTLAKFSTLSKFMQWSQH